MQEVIRDFDLRPWAPPTLDGTLFFPGYERGRHGPPSGSECRAFA